mmetsp:Transcript_7148/g.24740  ORF Transcript_7148/g.24740 Transcript_7148/m.24740 type:complete len:789 (+) Transcript_7148:93-2459(+)
MARGPLGAHQLDGPVGRHGQVRLAQDHGLRGRPGGRGAEGSVPGLDGHRRPRALDGSLPGAALQPQQHHALHRHSGREVPTPRPRRGARETPLGEGEAAADEGARTVRVAVAVVHVKLALRLARHVERHDEGHGVVRHGRAAATRPVAAGEHGAPTDVHGDAVHARLDGLVIGGLQPLPRAEIEPPPGAREAERHQGAARGHHGADEEGGPEHEHLLLPESPGILREVEPEGAQRGLPLNAGIVHERVHVGENLVAGLDRVADVRGPWLAEEPGLAALGVQVRVAAEERVEGAELVPPGEELRVGVTEEPAHVGPGESEPGDPEAQQHGHGHLEVMPVRGIVARPDRPHALRAREEGTGEDKGAIGLGAAGAQAVGGGEVVVHAVDVVHVAVLHAPEVEVVLLHGHLGAVEHRGLVHVVPDVQVGRGALVLGGGELARPPVADLGVGDVEVGGGARPAPPVEVPAVLVLDVVAKRGRLLVHGEVVVPLHMRVHNRHHLAPFARNLPLHTLGGGEVPSVPRHVTLAVRMLDVQPQHVVRDVVLVEPAVHQRHVRLVLVVPAALVVPQGEHLRQLRRPGHLGVLLQHLGGRGAREEEHVHDARLGDPLGVGEHARGAVHVDVHLGGIEPEHARREPGLVTQHEGDGSVEAENRLRKVLEHVEVVHAVRLGADAVAARGLEAVPGGVLGDAVDVPGALKAQVKADRSRALGLGVLVGLERLLPLALNGALGGLGAVVLEEELPVGVECHRGLAVHHRGNAEGREVHDTLDVAGDQVQAVDDGLDLVPLGGL